MGKVDKEVKASQVVANFAWFINFAYYTMHASRRPHFNYYKITTYYSIESRNFQ